MSATVIVLPSAAMSPVARAKLRPGRPPKGVVSLGWGKRNRAIRKSWADRADELEAGARFLRLKADDYVALFLDEAARLEAQAMDARRRSF